MSYCHDLLVTCTRQKITHTVAYAEYFIYVFDTSIGVSVLIFVSVSLLNRKIPKG